MKKIIPVIALILAVFASCSKSDISENNIQTPKTNHIGKSSAPEFFIEGELPNIGEFSGKSERFHSQYTPYFIPCEKYGQLLPYIGTHKIFSDVEQSGVKMGFSSYGFCTQDGRIVMDAASCNRDIYYTKTDDGFGFYRLSITDDFASEQPDDIYMPQKSVLIPESGKWCIELSGNSWISEAKNGMIVVMSYATESEHGEFIIYDYDGKEILRPVGYDNILLCDNGLLLAMRWGDDSFYQFLDKDGNAVLGPFISAEQFSEFGIANVETSEGWHLIDEKGNILTKQPYENITLHKKDYSLPEPAAYVAQYKNNRYKSDIYSADGKYLSTVTGTSYFSLRFPENGDIIYYYTVSGEDRMVWRRISDHSDIIGKDCRKSPNLYSGSEDIFVYEDKDTHTALLFDANGETVLKVEDFMELGAFSKDGTNFVYSTGYYEEYYDEDVKQHLTRIHKTSYLYDTKTKKSTLIPAQSSDGFASFVGKNSDYLMIFASEEENFFGDYDRYSLYDIKNEKLLFENSQKIIYNCIGDKDYFTVCGESICTLYDSDMNVIIRSFSDK